MKNIFAKSRRDIAVKAMDFLIILFTVSVTVCGVLTCIFHDADGIANGLFTCMIISFAALVVTAVISIITLTRMLEEAERENRAYWKRILNEQYGAGLMNRIREARDIYDAKSVHISNTTPKSQNDTNMEGK